MLLAIDSGNTNLVFAVLEGDQVRGSWRTATDPNRTADEYAVWLIQLMGFAGLRREQIRAAVIANVVPEAGRDLALLCTRYFGCEPMTVARGAGQAGVEIAVDHPEEVGADRLVNAIGAHALHGGPAIVIDFGTATNFDVVDARGAYRGGVICPGVGLSLQALHLAAAKLPRVEVRRPAKVIGTGTVSAMESGIFWGYAELIGGLVRRIEGEIADWPGERRGDGRVSVIATGGLARVFADVIERIDDVDDDLTLQGLRLLHERGRALGEP